MAHKIYSDISKLKSVLTIIEEYNNFTHCFNKDDINYLRETVDNLLTTKDTKKMIEDFKWCLKAINICYQDVDPEFKKAVIKIKAREREDL